MLLVGLNTFSPLKISLVEGEGSFVLFGDCDRHPFEFLSAVFVGLDNSLVFRLASGPRNLICPKDGLDHLVSRPDFLEHLSKFTLSNSDLLLTGIEIKCDRHCDVVLSLTLLWHKVFLAVKAVLHQLSKSF